MVSPGPFGCLGIVLAEAFHIAQRGGLVTMAGKQEDKHLRTV
jgi:hypothetical protein